jgi:hypothetical protein
MSIQAWRRAARSTKWAATISLSSIWMNISRRLGSPKTKKVHSSARPLAGRASCPSGPCRASCHHPIWHTKLNSNKDTKCEIGIYLRPFRPWDSALFATPKKVSLWSASFWGLIPTESCSFSSEKSYSPSRLMCCQEPAEPLATASRNASRLAVSSLSSSFCER